MREIKFRAWDDCAKKMVVAGLDDDYIFVKNECGFCVYSGSDGMEVYHLKLMQSTGLIDKNGADIFEGDIVKAVDIGTGEESLHTIKYYAYDDYPAFDLSPALFEESNSFSGIACSIQYEIEVVGNIYENSELMEVKND